MELAQYKAKLEQRGYRVKDLITYLNTPYGVWVQKIVEDLNGFGLVSVLNPCSENAKDPVFKLTEEGKTNARNYIREMSVKRKEILDAGKDTANDIELPTLDLIEEDVNFLGLDSDFEYYNGWGVTDHYDADYPLLLKLGRDLEVA